MKTKQRTFHRYTPASALFLVISAMNLAPVAASASTLNAWAVLSR